MTLSDVSKLIGKPLICFFFLFVCIFLLSSMPELIFNLQDNDWKALLMNLVHGVIFSYLITFCVSLVKSQKVRRIITAFFLVLLSVSYFCDIICVSEFHSDFTGDFISAILGTDSSEISEFIGLHSKGLAIGVVSLLVIIGGYWFLRNVQVKAINHAGYLIVVILLGCIVLFNLKPKARARIITEKSFEGKFVAFFHYIQDIPPKISSSINYEGELLYDSSTLPNNIVIIFGESHCRRQCQFYGYDKQTMPRTQQLIDHDSLFVFDHITSAAISTIESFRSMLSTYKSVFNEDPCFWECPSLFQLMREAGYKETWISNQSKHGMFDNLIGNYADLCDTVIFLGDKFSGLRRTSKDGEMLPVLRTIHEQSNEHNLYFLHLMGNHAQYAERYPAEFNYFSASDYLDYPQSQRSVLATYDNSVRYTDWVINEVFNMFKDEDAIILYCPDHGLDLFYTREDYYLHALASDPASYSAASEIPFLIYPTSAFYEKHPDTIVRIVDSVHHWWNTEDLIYTVLDLAGISFSTSDDVRKYSLLLSE